MIPGAVCLNKKVILFLHYWRMEELLLGALMLRLDTPAVWAWSLHTINEAASPEIAGGIADRTAENTHLEKDAVAPERPGPVHLHSLLCTFLPVGWQPCVSQESHFLQSCLRDQLCSQPQFSPGHPWRVPVHPHFPVWPHVWANQPGASALTLMSAVGVRKWCSKEVKVCTLKRVGVRFSLLTPRRWKALFSIYQGCFWLMCLPEIWIFPQAQSQSLLNRQCYRQVLHNHQCRSWKAKKSVFFCL